MTRARSSPTLPLVAIDSREQQPLAPAVLLGGAPVPLPSRVMTLQSGDYSVEGFAPAHAVGDDGAPFVGAEHIVFERKSIADAWSTCFGRRNDSVGEARHAVDRFRDECARLSRFTRARIVIHGGWCPDIDGRPVHVDGTPAGLLVYARIRAARGGQRLAEANAASVMAILGAIDVDYGVPAQWCGSRGRAALYVGRALARVWWQAIGAAQAREAEARGVRVPWLRMLEKEASDAGSDDRARTGSADAEEAARSGSGILRAGASVHPRARGGDGAEGASPKAGGPDGGGSVLAALPPRSRSRVALAPCGGMLPPGREADAARERARAAR